MCLIQRFDADRRRLRLFHGPPVAVPEGQGRGQQLRVFHGEPDDVSAALVLKEQKVTVNVVGQKLKR